MPEIVKHRNSKTAQPNMTILAGTIEITAAGAILAQTGQADSGVVFTKNAAAGRYDGVIHRGYRRFMNGFANVITPTAGSLMVATDGNTAYLDGISAANANGTTPISTFSIQCQLPTGVATATNPKSGDFVSWQMWVSDSP